MKIWSMDEAGSNFQEVMQACVQQGPQVVELSAGGGALLISAKPLNAAADRPQLSLKEWLMCDFARTEDLAPDRHGK